MFDAKKRQSRQFLFPTLFGGWISDFLSPNSTASRPKLPVMVPPINPASGRVLVGPLSCVFWPVVTPMLTEQISFNRLVRARMQSRILDFRFIKLARITCLVWWVGHWQRFVHLGGREGNVGLGWNLWGGISGVESLGRNFWSGITGYMDHV